MDPIRISVVYEINPGVGSGDKDKVRTPENYTAMVRASAGVAGLEAIKRIWRLDVRLVSVTAVDEGTRLLTKEEVEGLLKDQDEG